MRVIRFIVLAGGIPSLYFALAFVGQSLTGGGHGPEFFGDVPLAPFSTSQGFAMLGLVYWPVVGTLLACRRFRSCRMAAAALLNIHYLGVVILIFQTDWFYVGRAWHSMRLIITTFVAVYLCSQVFMWVLIARRQSP